MSKVLKTAVFIAIFVCLVPVMPAQAPNDGCQPIRLLLQANLDFNRPIPYISWSGKVRGFLNDNVPLDGVMFGAGPNANGSGSTYATGQTGHDENLSFVFDFGSKGRFLTVPDKGIFPLSPRTSPHLVYPPQYAFGRYFYTAKVAPPTLAPTPPPGVILWWWESSGWFKNATGNISLSGMFLVNAAPPSDMGIWNAEITGRLCNVTP